ncbi:MAG: plasmid pRiA4b ORF-3 family protein [Spirochaetaceae bacterium]|nr:plasmid pRiA4b ORF-3 family protein [Spirochaetaceae bacterium]
MTITQEEALYEFLENVREPFTLKDITQAVRSAERSGGARLTAQIAHILVNRRLVFECEKNSFLSRRGLFEKAQFVIQPSNSELINGVLIPGHRCIPFANPQLLPHQYRFYFQGRLCPVDTSEGAPEDFYPYYSLFGEEYAPHYIAGDNRDNETAFSFDPNEEPTEVSISSFDMRGIFREIGFVPGDRFIVTCLDWKAGTFNLDYVKGGAWDEAEMQAWATVAEKGFFESFEKLGPGHSCEEQLAWAYFYGGERMRKTPAYSLEDFLFKKTEKIDTVPFGIESRFWRTGKDIPDFDGLNGVMTQSDQTQIEIYLAGNGIPVSEFVIQSFVRDGLFRNEQKINHIIERIMPPSVRVDRWTFDAVCRYVYDIMAEFSATYSLFKDKTLGPVRQRVGELHTAVIDLAARLSKGMIDKTWFPMHTFVILSQIQNHSAAVLEDLDVEEDLPELDLAMMEASLDSMIDTYEEVRALVDEAMINFRKTTFSLVRADGTAGEAWMTVQFALGGTDIWRRVTIPSAFQLSDLQRVIQAVFSWSGHTRSRFSTDFRVVSSITGRDRNIDLKQTVGFLSDNGLSEFVYEYGLNWTVKVMILSKQDGTGHDSVTCITGEGAVPDEKIEGPLRYRRLLSNLENGNQEERNTAVALLGEGFDWQKFDIRECNRALMKMFSSEQIPETGAKR